MLLAVLAALFILACFWASVRDRYDQARWQAEPYYPRYGASNLHVLRWWLGGAAGLAIVLLIASQAVAHDHNRPELNEWLKSLHSNGKTWCCDGNDTDEIDDWETKGNRYRVRFRGIWYDVPEEAVVDGPNKSGAPLLWMYKGYMSPRVRCFMPGSMT